MSASKEQTSSPSAALGELTGTVLEQRYELGRVLGSGGMGAVFAARHLRLDRPVAIKVLRPMYAAEGEYIERFLREAKAASKIRHRNVVEIHDYGEAKGGLVYSVMEYLVGQDLQQLLSARPDKRIPWAEACGLLAQIASGLKAAHGQQVIHRDIKPANCFVTEEDGEPLVKLVDFGIARIEGSDRGATLTGAAQVLGTPSYIAPELAQKECPASPQSDMYALGVVAYRMLTGRVPFGGATVFEILRHACFDPVPPIRARVPEPVERFVMELLAKEPEQRPADMQAVRQRLVALSRETIGAQAVVIPVSSGLPLSPGHSVPPPGATEHTLVQREEAGVSTEGSGSTGAGADTEQPAAREVGITAVMMEPLPESLRRPAPRPAEAPPRLVVAAAAGAPQRPVIDATSAPGASPFPSGETVPAIGEAMLRSLEQSGTVDRPRRKAWLWAGLGGVVVLVAGAFAVPTMMGDADGSGDTPAAELTKAVVNHGSPELTQSTGAVASTDEPVESSGLLVVAAAEGTTSVDVEASAPTPSSSDGERSSSSEDGGLEPEPSQPRPRPATVKKSKPRAPAKPAGPPKDSVVLEQLSRTIAKRCAEDLGGSSVTVKFLVSPSGGVSSVVASGPADACAKVQIQGAKFRPRTRRTPVKFTVK